MHATPNPATHTPPSPAPCPFLQLEQRLFDAYSRRSSPELASLMAPEFQEFAAHGTPIPRATLLEALDTLPSHSLTLSEFSAHPLGADAVLNTYRATTTRPPPENRVSHSLRSSVWERRGGRWQLVFHQGTRIP